MNGHTKQILPKSSKGASIQFVKRSKKNPTLSSIGNKRFEQALQRKVQAIADNSPQVEKIDILQRIAKNYSAKTTQKMANKEEEEPKQRKATPIQKKENKTGLPDNLKSGIENLSGHSMDEVKVHYNSAKPAQLQAHAYAQGSNIHIASGQEKHLPHEAWHVVQQKQGRVKPTMQMKGVNINDNKSLENEADQMGMKALQMKRNKSVFQKKNFLRPIPNKLISKFKSPIFDTSNQSVVQAKILKNISDVQISGDDSRVISHQLAENLRKFAFGNIVGHPNESMDTLFNNMDNEVFDNDHLTERVKKTKEEFWSFVWSFKGKTWGTIKREWLQQDEKIEKLYMTVNKNKANIGGYSMPMSNAHDKIIKQVHKGETTENWRRRKGYGGVGSHIPKSDQHYAVGPNASDRNPGPERAFTKKARLTEGEGLHVFYSPTHGDTKSRGAEEYGLVSRHETIDNKRIVAPWDPYLL